MKQTSPKKWLSKSLLCTSRWKLQIFQLANGIGDAAYLPNTLNIAKELVYEYDLKSNFTFLTCKTLSNRTGNNPLPSLMRANNISTITLTVFSSSIF